MPNIRLLCLCVIVCEIVIASISEMFDNLLTQIDECYSVLWIVKPKMLWNLTRFWSTFIARKSSGWISFKSEFFMTFSISVNQIGVRCDLASGVRIGESIQDFDSLTVERGPIRLSEFGFERDGNTGPVSNLEEIELIGGNVGANIDATGFPGDLTIIGTFFRDTLKGGAGNDTIIALSGSDEIDGGPGHDFIDAGLQPDTAMGGAGNDTIDLTGATSGFVELWYGDLGAGIDVGRREINPGNSARQTGWDGHRGTS